MKKILLIFLLFTVIVAGVFANGKNESYVVQNTDTGVISEDTVPKMTKSLAERLASQVGTLLNRATLRLTLALSPFPAITSRFYGLNSTTNSVDYKSSDEDLEPFNISKHLLISNEAYNNSSITNEINSWMDTSQVQKSRWGVVFWLVIAFTFLEVLYIIVFPQVERNGEAIDIRTIVVKVFQAFLIVILLSALPYLLEVTRYGFVRIVGLFAKDLGTSDSREQEAFSMVTMPGYLMNELSETLSYSDPTKTLNDDGTALVSEGSFGKALVKLLYLVFEFFMFIMAARVAIQIMIKVLEAYLLMTVCMITMPFSLFTPLKSVGEKSALSLLSSTIECFVIAMILATVVPAVRVITTPFLKALTMTQEPAIYVISMDNDEYFTSYLQSTGGKEYTTKISLYTQLVVGPKAVGIRIVQSKINPENPDRIEPRYYLYYYGTFPGSDVEEYFAKQSGIVEDWNKVELKTGSEKPDADATRDSEKYREDKTMYLSVLSAFHEAVKTTYAEQFAVSASSVSGEKQERMLELITSYGLTNPEIRLQFFENFKNAFNLTQERLDISPNANQGIQIEKSEANTLLIQHMILVFLAVFIPTYFVRQSSSITSMILSGSVGQSSAAEDISRSMFRASRAITNSVSIVGNIARAFGQRNQKPREEENKDEENDSPQGNAHE